MAGRKLWLENDVRTAMMMLKSADTRLEDLADPSLFPVRKLIAQDIQTLHQVNPVSNSSIALALSGMIPQVEQLAIATLQIPTREQAQQTTELSENVSDWRSNLSKTWQAIRDDFISVSRTEQAIEPYLSDKQQWLVKEQLKYALTQAQGAVLNDNETLFKASLQQATALIIEYYDLSSVSVDQFSAALQQLSATSIAKNYPSRLASQDALSDIIESRVENVFSNKQAGEL
jgi:uroporphyrin-3 C-methyltransferase